MGDPPLEPDDPVVEVEPDDDAEEVEADPVDPVEVEDEVPEQSDPLPPINVYGTREPGTDDFPKKVEPTEPQLIVKASNAALRRRAHCLIWIQGVDVTDKLLPFLVSVRVIDRIEGKNQAYITLDDRDARLPMFATWETVRIYLGWAGSEPAIPIFRRVGYNKDLLPQDANISPAKVNDPASLPWSPSGGAVLMFHGVIEQVECAFSRKGGGRQMIIQAGPPMHHENASHGKESKGDGFERGISLGAMFSGMMGGGGVSPSMEGLARSYFFRDGSPQSAAAILAAESGGSLTSSGKSFAFTNAIDGLAIDGAKMAMVEATWGVNLISYRIIPYILQHQFRKANVDYFNNAEGVFKRFEKAIGGKAPFNVGEMIASIPGMAPNRRAAQQKATGIQSNSETERGNGWCIINGEPMARANASLVIDGARPGVDGIYRMKEVESIYQRQGGYITRCVLDNPEFSRTALAEKITPKYEPAEGAGSSR